MGKKNVWKLVLFAFQKYSNKRIPAPWYSLSVLYTEGKGEQETPAISFSTEFVQMY